MSDEMKDNRTPEVPQESEATMNGEQGHNEQHLHGEHHHRSGHHHHRHHKKRTKKEKLKHFFKKHKMGLVIAISAFCVSFMAVVLIVDHIQNVPSVNLPSEETDGTNKPILNSSVYIGAPLIDGEVYLVGDAAKEYFASDISVRLVDIYEKYKDSGERLDAGVPLKFKFDVSGLPTQISVTDAQLEVAENADFSHSVFYELDAKYSTSIYNLKTGTAYSYRAVFTLSNGTVLTHGGHFTTASTPRMMTIDGIYNVRDIGGWKTVDGRIVKQGLLYRGTELDGAVEEKYLITQDGINELLLNLGVKTDMDLRSPEDRMPERYVLGTNVEHKYYNAVMYGGIFADAGKDGIREIFHDLADSTSYPIYLHCTYGCDRTGTVCYLLNALLGVSENDLIRDYELSAFFAPQIDRANIKIVYDELQNYSGFTIQEKTENYLLSIGVTAEEIASIRNIFLG